jgi:hypothetical protein
MVKVTSKNYYLDGYLKENLDHLSKAVSKGWDGVVLIDGVEGSAKSTLGSACAYYLDNSFSLDRVVFSQEQFMKAVDSSKPGSAIVWDEFIMGGLSTEAMSRSQNVLIKKMTTIRKKNLYIFLIVPWFFMVRAYFAVGRSRALIHTYSPDGISRGYFQFYSYKTKKSLYLNGRKRFNYNVVKPDFNGRFTNTFGMFWDAEEYDKKKEEAILKITDGQAEKVTPAKEKAIYALLKLIKEHYSFAEISRLTGIPLTNVHRWHSTTQTNDNNNLIKSI